jgi:acyl-CoA synthetase (AMP-forming)/AMP-acid ligase II/acyl carrier protein
MSETGYECDPARDCPSLVDVLRRRAAATPDQTAFVFLSDGETEKAAVTYRELDRQAREWAARLQALGLGGARVLLLYPPGLDYVAAFLGCLYAGSVAVPAYPPRKERSLERLRAIAADAGAAAVIATPSVRAMAGGRRDQWPELHDLAWLTGNDDSVDADSWRPPSIGSGSLAMLQFTSGSTETPRGVMLTHGNLMHNCEWVRRRFGHASESVGVIWLPPYHDMGLIGGILQPLYTGFPCYLMSPVSVFSNPFAWLQAVTRCRATTSGGPDFAYDLCARKITPEQRAALDLSAWQVAFTGAEPVRAETLERFATVFAPCGFRRESFYPCYGLAEATLIAAGGRRGSPLRTLSVSRSALEANLVAPDDDVSGRRTLVGCGTSLDDQRAIVVDPERFTRCPPGRVGEIWLAGPSVAQGYWGRRDDSERSFGARLSDTGDGPYLRTGDLGFLHEGDLFITGRLKDLLVLHGRNLYPQDLERTAERCVADLQPGSGAAFGIEEGGQERLVIAYEAIPRRQLDPWAVGDAVRRAVVDEHDADLHAFVLLRPGGLPKTSSGKIQRGDCRRRFLAGTLDAFGEWRPTGRSAPCGLTRSALLGVPPRERQEWLEAHFRDALARLLRVDPSEIDPQRPLNTFGLSSLRTVELKNTLEESLSLALPVTSFLQAGSLAQLASEVHRELSWPPSRPEGEDVARLLRQLQQLSDDQVKRLLTAGEVCARGVLS